MRARVIISLAAAMAGLWVGTPQAEAQFDYSETCAVAFSPAPPFVPGQEITILGEGFAPGFHTEILLNGSPLVPTPVATDVRGGFTTSVRIPLDVPGGEHVISVICHPDALNPNIFTLVIGGRAARAGFTLDSSTITCGGVLTGAVVGARPGSTVTFREGASTLATVVADGDGRAALAAPDFVAPRATGTYTIIATGVDSLEQAFELTQSVTITRATEVLGQRCTPLARTGSDTSPMVVAGAGLASAGLALVLVARRRRDTAV